MEESPLSSLEGGYSARSTNMTGNKQHDDQQSRIQYSMPGILHFLQTEWTRFEIDRAQWEIDRAELQVSRKGSRELLLLLLIRYAFDFVVTLSKIAT